MGKGALVEATTMITDDVRAGCRWCGGSSCGARQRPLVMIT